MQELMPGEKKDFQMVGDRVENDSCLMAIISHHFGIISASTSSELYVERDASYKEDHPIEVRVRS